MRGPQRTIAETIVNSNSVSLKRLAWAFGCSKKDSDEERQLRELLVARIKEQHD